VPRPAAVADITVPCLRELAGRPDELDAVQRVLQAAPRYAQLSGEASVPPNAARALWQARPPGRPRAGKHVYAVDVGGETVGVVDVVVGYPDDATAFIGLLLLDEAHEGRGLGGATLGAVEAVVRARWPEVGRLRLGVLRDNARALRFWARHGFVATGEVKPFRAGSRETEVRLFDKRVPAGG
jgi:GNAT superfamily N-acetyltransferase